MAGLDRFDAADLAGRPTLKGERYVLFGKIAEGGMAAVYRAWDTQLKGWRAVKVLLPDFANRKKIRSRFESEARAMAAIDHRHVVRVFDVVTEVPLPYIVMEVADGGSLHDWVDRHGPMPPRLAVHCTLEVADGLSAAHALGIIHRDVKPQNVLLDREGRCLVSDFGIARVDFGDMQLTRTGTSMGTIGYMAPEQRSDAKVVDQRADVYATGALLFKLLTSVVLTDMFMIGHDPELIEPIPDPLRPALVAACAHDRTKRTPDLPAFASALRAALLSLPEDPPGVAPLARDEVPDDDESPAVYSPISALLTAGTLALHDSTVPMYKSVAPAAEITVPALTQAATFTATLVAPGQEPTTFTTPPPAGPRRPSPTPTAAPRTTSGPGIVGRVARVGLVFVGLAGIGCGSSIGLTYASVRGARTRELAARSGLYQQISADQGLVDLVTARSDDPAATAELLTRQSQFAATREEPERSAAADRFASMLLAQTQPLLLSGSLGTADVQASNLARAHAEWTEARDAWLEARSTPPTSWLVPLVARD